MKKRKKIKTPEEVIQAAELLEKHGDAYLDFLKENRKKERQAKRELLGWNMEEPPEKDYI